MEYTDLNAEIIPLVGGVADPSILRTVRNVAVDFAKRTKLITHTVTLTAADYVVTYTHADTNQRVYTINRVKYHDQEILAQGRETGAATYEVTLPGFLPPGATVEIEYVLIPTRTSTECDDRIMDSWYEAIVAGTLANLFAMKTASWFDPAMSQSYGANYAQAVFDATIHERQDDTRQVKYMAYGGL